MIAIRHRIAALCFLAVFVGYSDRVNMAVASVAMGEALGWTQSRKGVVLSAFFVGYIVSLIPSGWLAMRFGGRRMLPIARVSTAVTVQLKMAAYLMHGDLCGTF